MAKQGKVLPARRMRDEESMLIRSAESLGRMIGSLQRELDDATRKLPRTLSSVSARADGNGRTAANGKNGKAPRKTKKTARAKSAANSGAQKVQSTADRKSKRASKSGATRTPAARNRSGASLRARKASRHA